MLKTNKINKSKVTDPTMVDDVTYLNYLALAGAILLEEDDENYKYMIVDARYIPKGEIGKKKIKVINIKTGEINIYNNKKECMAATGIRSTNIITYIRKDSIFKETYFFTIVDDTKGE